MTMERPAFFKFFLPETSEAHLKIPTPFIKCIRGSLPEKVFLRDRYNNLWTVKVEHVRENWYFGDGWAKFVKDNRVTFCDFLVFEYFLVGLFDFKILGPSATEKEGAGAFLSKGMKEVEHVSEEVMEKEVEKEDDDCVDANYISKRQKFQSEANGNDDDETNDADYLPGQDNGREDEVEQVNKVAASTSGNSYANQTNLVPKYCGSEIFQSGLAPLPKNPYFVVKIMTKRKGDLFIPLCLIKDHNLQLPNPEMILVDPRGRKFCGKYRKWKDGRILYSGGWKRLCNSNLVEREDLCICEFLQGERDLYLNVSFVRADTNGGNRKGR